MFCRLQMAANVSAMSSGGLELLTLNLAQMTIESTDLQNKYFFNKVLINIVYLNFKIKYYEKSILSLSIRQSPKKRRE